MRLLQNFKKALVHNWRKRRIELCFWCAGHTRQSSNSFDGKSHNAWSCEWVSFKNKLKNGELFKKRILFKYRHVPGGIFPHPVAFYKDEKGNMIGVDKKGNVTSRNPYSEKNDYRGWKHAGHKDTSGYERRIHLDENKNPIKIVREK